MPHSVISPAILYFGTPVVLVTSENEDGPDNICPISSVFWLGHRCILGFASASQTPLNILRTGNCVVNLVDDTMTAPVNALASTTGNNPPSASKLERGYRYVKDKWAVSGLTPEKSDFVRSMRIRECPVQMECELAAAFPLMEDVPDRAGLLTLIELKVLRTHVVEELRMDGHPNRIDPDAWRPMIMSFQELYGLGGTKLGTSSLARVNEEKYRLLTKSDVVSSPGDRDQEIAESKAKMSDRSIVTTMPGEAPLCHHEQDEPPRGRVPQEGF
jgi:flavin reductase (DIM6/NTAB) family NADH-FMN oxidoreductase RutF